MLLRGVNVGRHNRIAMSTFRDVLGQCCCTRVATHLRSGKRRRDVVEDARRAAGGRRGRLRDVDVPVEVLVRTSAELDAVVADNPFQVGDPTLLHVVFLSGPPPELDLPALLPHPVAPGPACLYVAYADSTHDSTVARLLTGRRFPLVATTRTGGRCWRSRTSHTPPERSWGAVVTCAAAPQLRQVAQPP